MGSETSPQKQQHRASSPSPSRLPSVTPTDRSPDKVEEDVEVEVTSRRTRGKEKAEESIAEPAIKARGDGKEEAPLEIAFAEHEEYEHEPPSRSRRRSSGKNYREESDGDDEVARKRPKRGRKSLDEASPYAEELNAKSATGSAAVSPKTAPVKLAKARAPLVTRANHPKEVIETLTAWLAAHTENPYPTDKEKLVLMKETGLNLRQVNDWFINGRRRVLPKILLEEALAEQAEAEAAAAAAAAEKKGRGGRKSR